MAIAAIKNQNVIGQAGKATGIYNNKVNEEIGDLGSYEGFLNEAGGNTILGDPNDKTAPTKPTEMKNLRSTLDTISVRATGGTDESGVVAGYKYSIDGNNWSDIVKPGVYYYTFRNLNKSTQYTIYAKTVDGAGNESEVFTTRMSTSYEITFYVDDVAYTAYEGMYWEEWIASDWNTGDFSYNWVNNQVLDGEGNVLYESDNGIGWVCGDKNNEIHAHIRYKAKF